MTKICDVTNDNCESSFEDNETHRVKKFSRDMLRGNLFMGTYHEQRLVESLHGYRHVIKISNDQVALIDNLIAVKQRCDNFFNKYNTWIGITDPKTIGAPVGYNVWVLLDREMALGSYWFKIKTVEFQRNEVRLKLQVLHSLTPMESATNSFQENSQNSSDNISDYTFNIDGINVYLKAKLYYLLTEMITLSNVKETLIFLFMLLSTIATFSVYGIQYFLEYFLKLLHELSRFVKAVNPVLIASVHVLGNCFNGLLFLIAYMWSGQRVPQYQQGNARFVKYPRNVFNSNLQVSAVEYRPRLAITELN